jgi:hemerythrin-like domain-containing protein
MNPFELLISDHRKVAELFDQIENDGDLAMQENLFARIKQELTLHTEIEETYFYPRLKKYQETENLVVEAVEEHKEVKDLLDELDEMSPDDEDWEGLIQDLKEAVELHIEEEENDLFPKAQAALSEETINLIGDELQNGKRRMKSVGI